MSDYIFQNQYGVVTATKADSPREIRFITPSYRELFSIKDGESVLESTTHGVREVKCKYLDDYHLLYGTRTFHICELAEYLQRNNIMVMPYPDRRVVWSDMNLELKDWIEELSENEPGLTREQYIERMEELNASYLSDERMNLDVPVDGTILVIADLGLWDGRHQAYKEIRDATLADCLDYRYDRAEWYVTKDGDFCGEQVHHDGTNYYVYRKVKDNVTPEQLAELELKLYNNEATREDIDRLTEKLGRRVGVVYGWKFPDERETRNKQREER